MLGVALAVYDGEDDGVAEDVLESVPDGVGVALGVLLVLLVVVGVPLPMRVELGDEVGVGEVDAVSVSLGDGVGVALNVAPRGCSPREKLAPPPPEYGHMYIKVYQTHGYGST